VLSWAVKGIVAVRSLHVVQSLFYCSYLTVSFVALLFVGKKLA